MKTWETGIAVWEALREDDVATITTLMHDLNITDISIDVREQDISPGKVNKLFINCFMITFHNDGDATMFALKTSKAQFIKSFHIDRHSHKSLDYKFRSGWNSP